MHFRTAAVGFTVGVALTASSVPALATLTEPSYSPIGTHKLSRHHCPTEDSYMFIPAHRVKRGVRIANNHVYCVQIDSAHRALRNP